MVSKKVSGSLASIGIALRLERSEIDRSEGPAGEEEAVPILFGELSVTVHLHPGGRAAIDLDKTIDRIEKVGRPVERALVAGEEPAVVSPDADVEDPAVGVPGQLVVAFPVGIEGEEVAVFVEGQIVVIAEAMGDHFALLAVGRDAEDSALDRFLDGGSRGGDVLLADPGVVSAGHVEPTVRSLTEAVRAVFAAAARKLVEEFGIAFGKAVAGPVAMQKDPVGLHAEEVSTDEQKPVSVAGLARQAVDLVGRSVSVGIRQDLDIAGTGNCHPAVGGDRHGPGVVGQIIAGELGHVEALRDAKGSLAGAESSTEGDCEQDGAH